MYLPEGGIAFFDSGIGGMTVLAACEKHIKNDVLYYYGDNTHAPYGNLAFEKIRQYVFDVFDKFALLKVRAAVVACNTATAVCIEELRKKYPFPIIGTEPALRSAAGRGGEILVLTTQATYESKRFQFLCQNVQRYYPQSKISSVPCKQLAYQIERNIFNKEFDYTPFLPVKIPDAVVLGCTHYVYIEEQIGRYYGCPIYHGNEGIARRLCDVLGKNRDGRPPIVKGEENLGFSTTNFPQNCTQDQAGENANFCSHFNSLNPVKIQGKRQIYFLGENAENNAKIYKQTYVRV